MDFSAPNGAKHDLKATVDASQVCKDVVIAFSDKLRKRRQAVLSPTNTSDSVFIRIEGLDASNTYSLDIMEGVSSKYNKCLRLVLAWKYRVCNLAVYGITGLVLYYSLTRHESNIILLL